MLDLKQGIISLYKKVTTSLPPDVEQAIKEAAELEPAQSEAKEELFKIINTVKVAREETRPTCLDTGVPVFYVSIPIGLSHAEIKNTIIEATKVATQKLPLPSNAVDIVTDKNSDDNTGEGFPIIYIEEASGPNLTIELMLLGSGSEILGRTYSLPDDSINADRDFSGIKKCVMDSIKHAQGGGCPPYIIGVGIASTRDRAAWLSKNQLRRKLSHKNPSPEIAKLEQEIHDEVNNAGYGIGRQGGKTTTLGVKVGVNHRHIDTYYVDVYLLCWNTRRGKLIW